MLLVVCIAVLALLILVEFVFGFFGKKYMNELSGYLYKGDYESFDRLSAKKIVQWTVPPFNYHYLKLNRYFMTEDHDMVHKQFEMFKKARLNNSQKKEILVNAFQYYLNKKEKEESLYYLNEIKRTDLDGSVKTAYERLYDVFLNGNTELLETLIGETEGLEDRYKGTNEYMISKIYKELGRKDLAEEYQKRAEKHIGEFKDSLS